MVFLGGPRQVGKTTLAKGLLRTDSAYFNWDFGEHRQKLGLAKPAQLQDLIAFGGFPEPFFAASADEARRWSREHRDDRALARSARKDLRDLSPGAIRDAQGPCGEEGSEALPL